MSVSQITAPTFTHLYRNSELQRFSTSSTPNTKAQCAMTQFLVDWKLFAEERAQHLTVQFMNRKGTPRLMAHVCTPQTGMDSNQFTASSSLLRISRLLLPNTELYCNNILRTGRSAIPV